MILARFRQTLNYVGIILLSLNTLYSVKRYRFILIFIEKYAVCLFLSIINLLRAPPPPPPASASQWSLSWLPYLKCHPSNISHFFLPQNFSLSNLLCIIPTSFFLICLPYQKVGFVWAIVCVLLVFFSSFRLLPPSSPSFL